MAAKSHRRSAASKGPRRGHRASWRGMLRFGLVSFSVQAFNAHVREEGAVAFHQLHADCGRRIHYEKVCPKHGQVDSAEIITAFEYAKGKYVPIEDEELEAMHTAGERALTLYSFIDPEDFDPIYYDGRMYYLVPDGDAALEPFGVFCRALEQEGRCAVGQFVFSGKEQVVLVRAYDDVLHLALLNYEAEMRKPEDVAIDEPAIHGVEKKVRLAQQLIRSWKVDRFDFSQYTDEHLQRVRELIDAKLKGKKIEAPEEEAEPEVINLMDALKQSLSRTSAGRAHQAAAYRTVKEPKQKRRRRTASKQRWA